MSMYRFVKEGGSSKRLFVQGTLESDDSKPLKSSLKKSSPSPVGSPITTSLNLASVPRSLREGLTRHETVYDGNYPGMERTSSYRSGSYREESYNGRIVHDGNQTHFEYDGGSALAVPTSAGGLGMSELQAIHTNKRMSTEVLGSSLESTKISKKDDVSGQRRITTRIVRKVTTLTRGEEKASAEDVRGGSVHRSAEHYRHVEMESSLPRKVKISDIVIGQEANVTAREALLSWARRSTAKYPGVRVADFTSSWRDGLAFNALIHRNRPDLIDWRNIRSRQVRERLETAFHVVEKEYGVTRLLDPEDVDTHEPDEKSLITYISSLYETFPEPPAVHPLFDAESQRRAAAYTEQAAQHRAWLHEKCALMQDRAFPSTLIEMKKLLSESTRFRQEEVPLRQREKQKLFHHYRELEKYFESVGECDIEPTLRPDALEQAWSRLLMAQQERERDLTDEIRRLERLQRLAEKLHRDIKQTESGLDSVERHIESEIRRVERGVHPADAKLAAESIEQELRAMEHTVQEMFQDSHALREGRYPQAADLHRRVQQVHDRWLNARQSFTGRLVPRLSSVRMPVQQTTVRRETRTVLETRVHDADPKFQQLSEATRWCKERLKKLHESDYGSDLPSVQHELDKHQREHKQIDQFHSKVEQCVHNRANFSGEELNLYNQHLSQLQKLYAELLSTSTKRMSDLDALQDFLQSATAELNWLNEKEQVELSRDWADPHINLPAVQHYYEQLMSSLEKRELQFSNVIDRGEALIAQHHPATKTIESHLQVMQSQWAWVLQLTLCLETHLKHTTQYHNFFEEVKEAEKWIQKREEALNSTFSQSEFTLDQGERLLKGMQELREELNSHGGLVSRLVEDAQEIRPVKQRRAPITRPLRAETVCAYKHANVAIEKGSAVTVVDNSGRSRWRVRLGGAGTEVQVPGAVVALPPPCQDAIDAAGRLRSAYDRVIQLWQRKQLRMRQNMIFATIKVVKGWDFPQFVAMGAEQRQAIRRALNEDAEKLLAEGDPADPQLRRLRREIDDVNRLFDEFERRARAEEESKNAARIFTEQSSNLLERLEVLERQLHERIASHIPRDLDTLEHLVLQHKDWETSVHSLTSDVEEVQATFRGIALKTPAMKKSLDKVMGKWNDMQSKSQLFVDRLKFVEIVVNSMEENHQTISEFEIKLAQFNDLPNDVELLKDMHEDLLRMQVAVSKQQIQIDQMNDDAENCRRLVETSRAGLPHSSLPRSGKHIDLERLDKEVSQLNNRWNNVCSQLAERLRSCEAAYQLLRNYNAGLEKEAEWIEDAYSKLQAQPPIEVRPKEHFEPTRNLLTSVVERTPKIEKVNVDGGRYIREAKIYSSRCQRYAEWLCDEVHPSLDMRQLRRQADIELAERHRARGRTDPERIPSGSEAVARELDDLNANYQRLMDMLYERLRRIAAANPGDIVTLRLVEAMAPRSARSFRQEFNMQDLTTEHTYTTHYTTEKYVRTSHSTELDGQPVKSMTNGKLNSPNYTTKTIITEDDRPDVRNLKRVHRMYEGPNIIESKGILHPETKEILTVGQAISMRILDVRTGRLLSAPDTRQTISIEQAAKEGLIDPKLAARLTGPCGMTEDGNEVTLIEAIQRELYDAEQGLTDPAEKRVKVTVEGEKSAQGMSISDALNRGQVDLQRGLYRLPNGSYITIAEAYQRGYLIYNEIIKIKSSALCLSDAISQELVDNSGWILDRNSGDRYQIDVAIKNELINPNIREVVDPKNDTKITLAEAIEKNIINTKHSKYVHNITKEKLTFKDAASKRFICKPMTLKDVCDNNLMTNDGKILSPANRSPLNILEAISAGVLDSDNVKCITNTTTGGLLTLSEALGAKIILHDNKFRDNLTGEICTIPEAVDRGLITSVSQRSIFDIDGFKDPKTGEFVSFNVALGKGNLKYVNGETFLKSESGDWVFIEDCTKVSLVRAEVLEMFNRKIGIYENGKELSVLDAVFKNILDPKTGHLLEAATKKPIPFNKAVEINMITPEGAALLNSLLNITLTLQTVTKTVKRYVTVTNTSATQRSETIITFAEAIRRGLIDENTQTFTDPTTGTVFPIQQALDEGLLGVEKNEPRVVHISDRVKKDLVPGQVVELKITKKSFIKDLPPSPEGKVQRDSVKPETLKSPDFAVHETIQPREGLVQEIRTVTSKSVVTEPSVTSMTIKKNTIELPRGGWTLKEAIQQNLFDPSTGMFVIPGTDRVLDLEEAIKLNIINGDSANVVDPKSKKEIPLNRAIDSRIIDSTGHYKHKTEIITMKQAIERRFIVFIQLTTTTHSQKVITITSVAGMPDKMEISEMYDAPTHEMITEDQSALEPVQVKPGVIFDPATALVISTSSGVSENVLEAVDRGLLPANSVKVVEPQSGRPISLKQAVEHGIVDPNTGEYKDKTGKRISLVDAAKIGLVAVVGAPLVAASKVIQVVKSTMVVDPQTGENIPMEVAYERGLVDPVTYKKYEESIRDRSPETEVTQEIKTTSTSSVTYSQVTTTKTLPTETTVTVVVDPKTGEKLPIEVAYERGLIDPISYKKYELSIRDRTPEYAQRITTPTSRDITFTQVPSATTPDKVVTMVVDPKTGEQLPIEVAYERGILDPITYKIYQDSLALNQQDILTQPGTAKTVPGTSTVTISQVSKPVSVGAAVSEGFITVESIQNSLSADNRRVIETNVITEKLKSKPTDVIQINKTTISTKPKYKVNIGREQTPERQVLETKPIVLQKLRKHVVTPSEAIEQGLIDKDTVKILEAVKVYKDENGSPITLEVAIEKGIIDENKGKIVDPVRGDVLTIKEAINRGILDVEGQDEILIPLAKSLSIPEVLEQGLLDPVTGKIVHPETGDLLTLREAIICDIVDPLSSITIAPGKKITLSEAIERNIIDHDKNVIKTSDGPLDFVSAVNAQVFPESENKPVIDIPPAAMTLNIAIKKNLINPHTGEMKHPLTGEMTPVGDAVKKDLIMAIPFPQTSETLTLEEALDKGAVNLKQATFTDPKTKQVLPLDKALEQGLLAVKPMTDMQTTGVVTTITETFTSQHTVTTKMIELLADYVLVSSNEVQNTKTGEIISIDEARRQGIVRDEQTSKEQFITDTNINFEDALNLGYINIEAGTFTHPKTGETVTISEAVTSGLLNTEVPADTGKSSPQKQVLEMLDLNEAFELLFDEKTQKFRDPKSPNKVITFKEALEKKVINPDSVIYNVEAGKPVTLKEALNTGLIDKKTGKLKEPKTGKSVDIKNAAKMGLIAVVAAPVLAGMAVVQGAKSVTSKIMQPKQEKAVESPSRIATSEKTTRNEPDEEDKDKKPISKDKKPAPKDIYQPGKPEEKLQTAQPTWKEPTPATTDKTVPVDKKVVIPGKEPSSQAPEKYGIKEETITRQDPTRDRTTQEVVIDKKTVIIKKETSPDDVSSVEPKDTKKPKQVDDEKPGVVSGKTVVTETTTVHKEVPEKPSQVTPKELDIQHKQIVERPSPIKDMEHVVFEEKPAVEEFVETIVEGGKVITVTKTVVTKTTTESPEEISPKEPFGQSPKDQPEKQDREKTPISESKTIVQEKRTVITTAGAEKLIDDKPTSQIASQKPEDFVLNYDTFTKFDDGPTVQEIHEVTPDGKEITRIVTTTTSKSEPSEYVTEHSSTVITSSTSTLTTVEITQNESSSYQVITEEVSGPKDFTETVIQEYQVTEAPDETDDIQITKQYKISQDSEDVPKDVSAGKPDELQRDPNEKPGKGKDQYAAKGKTPEFGEQKELEPEKPLEVAPGVIYDPNTSVVISTKEGVAENLLEAVNKGIVPADTVKVVEPKTGKEITLKEAIKKGIVDSKTGEVKDKSGKKMTVADAAKIGLIAVVGAPVLAAAKVVQVVKKAMVVDPKTGEKVPLEQARERGLVDADTYKKYEEMIKTQTPKEIATEVFEQTTSKRPEGVTFTEQVVENYTTTTTSTTPGEIVITTTTEYTKPVVSEITTTTVEQKVIEFGKTTPVNVHDGKSVSAMLIDAERQPLRVIDEITEQNVTKEKAEPLKPLYENIPLIDAIAQGKIEPKVCRIIINGVESPLTVQDSLEQEQISRFAPVDVLSKNCIVLREVKPNYTVAISQRITPEELSEMGVYDIEKQIFLHPETGAKITFEELVYGLQIFDPESILVKDLSSKSDDYITFDEAIARPVIDKTTGHMVNPKTGKRVPFLECVQLGWIVEKPEDVTVPEQVTIESALEQGLYNPKTGEIKDVNTGALVPIGQAIEKGLVDQESLLIKVPRTNEVITLSDAIERNIVEIHEGVITIIETQEIIEITVAIQRGLLTVIRKPISIVAVIDNDMYEPKSGKIKDKVTEQLVSVGDAVDRNIVHPTISEIKDTATEKFISLSEALDTKLINPETGKIRDKKTGKDIPLDDALKKGLVATKAVTFSLFDVIELGYYSPESGKIMNPKTGQLITLGEAIKDNLVDPSDVKIKDDKSEAVVPFDKAVKTGLIDLEKGVITSPLCNLKDACDKGYLLSDKKPWTLQEGLVQGFYDPETGLLTINDVTMTLEDAIKIGNINPEALTVRNSITGEIISLADAIKAGIIDSKEGKVRDPIHGDKISLTDASERGLIVPAKRKLSLPEAVFKGFYDPKTGKFSNPLSKEKIPTDRAIKKRLIDPQSTLVHAAGKVIPFEFAVDRGIIDSRTGTIRLGDENIDFREAFERGILVEVRKPMSLIEAFEKGVYNEITGLFMDPQSGKKYTLVEAIKLNMIDAHSVHILDNRLGKWDKITLPESLETGVIDDQTGRIRNINSDNEEISLRKAFEIGLLVDSKAPISLQRALHQGLYDDSTGKIIDPATNRKITLHEALRRSIISPKYLCYFDKKSEKPLSLGDCCRSEIIDRRSGKFHEPGSDVPVSLSEAMSLGLIVDIESAGFTLYDALAMNMYSINELAFIHPVSDRPISLKTAITEEFINPETSLVKHIPSSKYIKLSEAISSGIVDDENSIYILPNGNQINLLDAKHRGLIVTTKKNLSLEEIIRNGLFRADNGKIVDPSTNEFVDINKAIETNLLNPDLTVVKDNFTNKFKPLPVAIQQGDVDVSKGRVIDTKAKKTYSLDIAFDKGLLVTVIQPITSQMVIKKYVSDSAASKEPILREFTLSEAITYEFIDPETAVIKDPHKNKYIPLKLGITEGIIDKNAKGSFDTQNRSQTLCFVFENGLIVYVREPLTFEQAIENGHLNVATARFTDPHSKEVLTIRDAATLGYIDPDTALIKDNLKKRLVKLPEAFRKGLMDAEKGNILDTETSKLNTLTAAIESGLLMTPKKSFTLIETLNFGIYNPTTGALNDPFITTSVMDRKRLNLGEAIAQGIVDPSSTVVKEPETGKICPLVQAIEQKLVDPVEGRLTIDPVKSISLDLVKALKKGYLLPAETRQAVEEKYRLCDETLSKLLEWIAVVEERLANQEAVKEDMDELRNQINILKLIKDDLESHQRQVSACADQAKQLVVSGGDVLAPHEVAALERGVRQLKQRCDKCTEKCDKMLRRLAAARDELGKFTNELNTFNTWMEGAYRTLEDKEAALSKLNSLPDQSEDVREFVSDVIAHQADLRFITMSAQKFVDESKEFLSILNEYRTSLPSRLSHIAPRSESGVREGAGNARRRHADLCARAQRLQDWLRGAADVSRHYHDALQRAGKWINEIEPQVRSVLSEPVGGEPRAVESQLSKAKTLHNEIISQGRLIDNAKDACEQLVKSLEGNLTPSEIRQLEVPVLDLTSRYKDITDAVGSRCSELEAALLQCQGLQDAAETQAHWVGQAESLFKSQQKPASLIRERLDEQIREQRISIGELEARRPTLAKLLASARQAALTPSNARIAKKLEQRAEDIYARYEKLVERSSKRSEFLEEVSSELAHFSGQAATLDAAHAQLLEQADTRELARMPAEELGGRLAQLANYRDKQMPLLEECLRNGKQLISKKDVTDTHVIRDRMKALENQWRDFNATLEEKQKLSKQRADQLNQYESLKLQVLDWLQSMESRVTRLQPVAVDLDVIKQQQDELRPLAKEYRDFSITIDKVNEAGAVYEALTRGDRADSPHRRRQIYSPTKRQTPSRTLDGRSPSPSKGHGLVSPGSTHSTSSGFSSRRSSQDGFHLEELSPVQQQLSEINNRYSLLGTKLADRTAELDAVRDELRRHLDSLRALNTFLDKVQRQLPKESVANTKEEADKTIKQARAVLEEMYEKQSILDSTKTQVRELLKRKQSVVGADRLHDEMEDVASRWKALHDAFKDKIRLMEEMKDFLDTYSNLSVWLGAKDRMMAALGPISSDSRMVQTQVQQVQVLREEFRGQQPQLAHLEEVGTAVLCRLEPASPDAAKLKQKVAEIQDRWNDLLNKLEKRADSLGAAADTSREFDAGLSRLRDALQTISDKLDDVAMENEPDEQLRKIENLERQLEGQRPLLADLEGAGAALAQVLSDPASRQDIQSKLAAVARQYDNLQRKLDHRKAEIEAALKDGRNLEENVARTLGWLQSELSSLPGRLQVSADAAKLQQQLERHEPLYRELTQREHELIMLLDKGREMEKKPAHQGLRKDLDRIQTQWDKLKRETVDRYTRLQTAKEHCRKFHKAQESFVPWLSDLEDRLAKLPATAFTKKEVEKQLRELQQIRNDIWKRSGEYENNKTLGETFISSCDVDQEVVRKLLDNMKERWDRINNEVLQQVEFLESTARKLGEFSERVRAVETPLQRCEERLQDALAAPPARAAETVASLADQIHALRAPLQNINVAADDIVQLAIQTQSYPSLK
ncbi:uncharacterized protein LOC118277469 isoform X41 [Spodoptera frugiperda]|uniref:Uncharacterized protein LOC118277469 isoform X41 n=1 Tax=Spodoptera frugiperda TaxID=7108 RepID=A0A9R0DSK9_SPOFR|nr:uncharacterized protein LOC118277469 isoform X41 [Spodoptera frugiperda]